MKIRKGEMMEKQDKAMKLGKTSRAQKMLIVMSPLEREEIFYIKDIHCIRLCMK